MQFICMIAQKSKWNRHLRKVISHVVQLLHKQ